VLRAKEVIDDAVLGKVTLSAAGWKHYTMEYTGSMEAAERAVDAYIERELAAGRKPE